jgi:N-acetylmuramoyl-L-alanine amidase
VPHLRILFCCATGVTCLLVIGCASGQAAAPSTLLPSIVSTQTTPTATSAPTPHATSVPTVADPSVPVATNHTPPYTIAIDPGHGGPDYTGAVATDSNGNLWFEKDLNLAVALRLRELLTGAGYNIVMLRTTDSTITNFDPSDYSGSVMRDSQARVDEANAAQADALVAIHFNGWIDDSLAGTEAYCDPARSFAADSCQLASLIQQSLVSGIRADGYAVNDLGVKNDAEVNGNPDDPHSWMLGTNAGFRPSLMPGTIVETLFLSNPDELAFILRPEGLDVIAAAYAKGIESYFAWLNGG